MPFAFMLHPPHTQYIFSSINFDEHVTEMHVMRFFDVWVFCFFCFLSAEQIHHHFFFLYRNEIPRRSCDLPRVSMLKIIRHPQNSSSKINKIKNKTSVQLPESHHKGMMQSCDPIPVQPNRKRGPAPFWYGCGAIWAIQNEWAQNRMLFAQECGAIPVPIARGVPGTAQKCEPRLSQKWNHQPPEFRPWLSNKLTAFNKLY